MIDFEVVGDLLRKAEIPHMTKMRDQPVITVVTSQLFETLFVFDRQGNLKRIETEEL